MGHPGYFNALYKKIVVAAGKVSHGGTNLEGESSPTANLKEYIASWRGDRCQSMDRINRVLEYVGHPHMVVPAFHVTGTNGKGSVSCAIASLLGALGLRTVLTTSPHLQEINERVVIDGRKITDEELVEYGTRVLRISERLGLRLSQHEMMTLIAFLLAKERAADFIVLEVGLGGRNDSTNVVRSTTVGVITSIGLDHVEMLGPTIEHIAREKVGIVKPNMRGLIVGPVEARLEQIIRDEAAQFAVPAFFSGHDIMVGMAASGSYSYYGPWFDGCFRLPFSGKHQVTNMSLAIAAVGCMGLSVPRAIEGLMTAVWPGRLEFVKNCELMRPLILDGAHNSDGAAALAEYLREAYPGGQFDFIFGAMRGKDWHVMLDQLLPYGRTWGLIMPSSERAESTAHITQYLTRSGVNSDSVIRLHDGVSVRQFINQGNMRDVPVVAFGSLYVIGELRTQLRVEDKPYWRCSHSSQ